MYSLAVMVFAVVAFSSCDKNDYEPMAPIMKGNQVSTSDNIAKSETRSLSDWKFVEGDETSLLMQHKSRSWYVVMFDLNKIKLDLVYELLPNEQLGNDPFLVRREIESWNKKHTQARALFNASFFLYKHKLWGEGLWGGKAKIAHFLSKNRTVITYGYEDCTTNSILFLNIYDNYATIESCTPGTCPLSSYAYGKRLVVGGLSPFFDRDKNKTIGRTMLGLKDSNHDGRYESVYVFVAKHSKGATQAEARFVLSNDFGCGSMIMFDGSASSSLSWNGKVKVKGTDYFVDDRNIPVLIKATKK